MQNYAYRIPININVLTYITLAKQIKATEMSDWLTKMRCCCCIYVVRVRIFAARFIQMQLLIYWKHEIQFKTNEQHDGCIIIYEIGHEWM